MKRIQTFLIGLACCACCSLAWAADKAHTVRTAQVSKIELVWNDQVHALQLDFIDDLNRRIGGVSFYLPDKYTLKSGKTLTLKDLEGVCLTSMERPYEVSGPTFLKFAKEFSVELKRGGTVRFTVQGKDSFCGQEWDYDVRGEAKIPTDS